MSEHKSRPLKENANVALAVQYCKILFIITERNNLTVLHDRDGWKLSTGLASQRTTWVAATALVGVASARSPPAGISTGDACHGGGCGRGDGRGGCRGRRGGGRRSG